ncbi:MAG TPA: PEP-CTERM sorting domain-containing protein [Vicinamibacterales bacterium]|nr:PEP-CTERM sorting domain-containing protein [Vicinamibacterales bacterium]
MIGWDNIRTFAHIPANMLGLADLNETLDLNLLLPFEVGARVGGLGGELIEGPVWWESDFPAESFFDVFFDVPVPEGNLGPSFESLLVADIINGEGEVIGRFWNLNPQCPEPGTFALIGTGLAALVLRLRRKK